MILNVLIKLVGKFVSLLLSAFKIPPLPPQISEIVNFCAESLQTGMGILANFCDLNYIMSLFGLILIIDGAIMAYRFVMWVLKKIPMLGIS